MSQTSHSYSRFSRGHGRLSGLLFPSRPVHERINKDKRVRYSGHGSEKGYISCDDGDGRRNKSCDDGYLRGDKLI